MSEKNTYPNIPSSYNQCNTSRYQGATETLITMLPMPNEPKSSTYNDIHVCDKYLGCSVFSILCCNPCCGMAALCNSVRAQEVARIGRAQESELYARRAINWNMISVVFGLLFIIGYFFMSYYAYSLNTSKK